MSSGAVVLLSVVQLVNSELQRKRRRGPASAMTTCGSTDVHTCHLSTLCHCCRLLYIAISDMITSTRSRRTCTRGIDAWLENDVIWCRRVAIDGALACMHMQLRAASTPGSRNLLVNRHSSSRSIAVRTCGVRNAGVVISSTAVAIDRRSSCHIHVNIRA
jgi:hypothetical protein